MRASGVLASKQYCWTARNDAGAAAGECAVQEDTRLRMLVRDALARRLARFVLVEADSCARESEPCCSLKEPSTPTCIRAAR
jgi:hypothetical protein